MDTISDIRTIRVIRSYAPDPLPDDELRAIVDAGRKAGSSKNTQRWDFIVVTDRRRMADLAGSGYYADHVPSAAAVIALIVEKPDPEHGRSILWDLGRAAQNMMLTAWALGVGSCPVTVQRFGVAARALALPDDRQCEYLITLGRPADPDDLTRPSRAGGRKAYDDVVHEETWS